MARLLGNTRRQINWVLWIGLLVALIAFAGAAVWLTTALVPLLTH